MRRMLVLVSLAAMTVVGGMAKAPLAVASDTSYSFNLVSPNTALAESGPFAGDTIRVTGAGSFDTGTGTITASGAFTHIKGDGSVFARGTWMADGFTSFLAFGGPNPGLQGGYLQLTVTLLAKGSPVFTNLPMTVTCVINAPPGYEEGITVGDFTESTGGTTFFHLDS